jgi:hypothetical protein
MNCYNFEVKIEGIARVFAHSKKEAISKIKDAGVTVAGNGGDFDLEVVDGPYDYNTVERIKRFTERY